MSISITIQESVEPGWAGRTAALSTIMLVPGISSKKNVYLSEPPGPVLTKEPRGLWRKSEGGIKNRRLAVVLAFALSLQHLAVHKRGALPPYHGVALVRT